jgi:hypothetical protein
MTDITVIAVAACVVLIAALVAGVLAQRRRGSRHDDGKGPQ